VQSFGQTEDGRFLTIGVRWPILQAISELSIDWNNPAKDRFPIPDSFLENARDQMPWSLRDEEDEAQGSYFSDGTYFGLSCTPSQNEVLRF